MLYSRSISWSTNYENMNSSKQESEMSSMTFRTPPMMKLRSLDGNNNKVNISSEKRVKMANELEMFNQSPFSHLVCDDCAFNHSGLILRWCDECNSAICDACILDRHPGHAITWYQEALRGANYKLDEVLENAKYKIKQLNGKRAKASRFVREIATKTEDMKAKVERRVKESQELGVTMESQWQEMIKLGAFPLTAKTACDRRHAATLSMRMADTVLERQTTIVKQLKRIHRVISEMVEKIDAQASEHMNDGK